MRCEFYYNNRLSTVVDYAMSTNMYLHASLCLHFRAVMVDSTISAERAASLAQDASSHQLALCRDTHFVRHLSRNATAWLCS